LSRLKIVLGISAVLFLVFAGIGFIYTRFPATPNGHESEPTSMASRYDEIPAEAVKIGPEMDDNPPVLHSFLWEDPVIMPGGVNTAGVEDSPFISPDGSCFYFFFTPDASAAPEEQMQDGVTGIWASERMGGEWQEATRVNLIQEGLSLDGCPYVNREEIWFCSARQGNYEEMDFWIGTLTEEDVVDVRNAGEALNSRIDVGELHISPDGDTIYYHADDEAGLGGLDIWAVERFGDGWGEPYNVEAVNSPDSEGYPYITPDASELWINKKYKGTPGIYRSKKIDDEWSKPQLILSSFAGEPNLDADGNLYFVHHYYDDGEMQEADIYVAYRKSTVTPADDVTNPRRGYLLGTLPTPHEGQTYAEAYEVVSETCELIPVWGKPSPFWEKASDLEGSWGELFIKELTRGNGMIPLIHFSFIDKGLTLSTPPGVTPSLSNQEWRRRYKRSVIESVELTRPVYVSLGNEVNRWYERYGWEGENGFKHWVSLYEEMYDEVKELSPETKVFCTFSREIVSENREADMSVLELFDTDKLDILALTSYPHSVEGINRPWDIPADYYEKTSNIMQGKPIAFTEVSWPSMMEFGGEKAQAEFIERLEGELLRGLDVEFIMWSWLTDLDESDGTGLIHRNGTEKRGYKTWINLSGG